MCVFHHCPIPTGQRSLLRCDVLGCQSLLCLFTHKSCSDGICWDVYVSWLSDTNRAVVTTLAWGTWGSVTQACVSSQENELWWMTTYLSWRRSGQASLTFAGFFYFCFYVVPIFRVPLISFFLLYLWFLWSVFLCSLVLFVVPYSVLPFCLILSVGPLICSSFLILPMVPLICSSFLSHSSCLCL